MPNDAPKRIQRSRARGWKLPENAVIVTRPGKWGNPFPIIKAVSSNTAPRWIVGEWDGPAMFITCSAKEAADTSVRAFRSWIMHPAQAKLRAEAALALRGKDLCCWCAIDQPCHADVLLEIAAEAKMEG